jgi:hypothetical protein
MGTDIVSPGGEAGRSSLSIYSTESYKWMELYLNSRIYATTASFHILSNSLVTNHRTIRRYIVRATDRSSDIPQMNKRFWEELISYFYW